MAFLNKNNIHVFPVTNKPSEKQSRLTTEYNITNIVNRLLDTKSFVITSGAVTAESALEFNIQGYYVKVDMISDLGTPTTASDCYATITIISKTIEEDTADEQTFIELDGGEETKKNEDGTTEKNEDGTDVVIYTGVEFSWEKTAPNTEYTLHILHYDGTNYTIPRASKIRFNQYAINKIDDGDLDDNSTIYN